MTVATNTHPLPPGDHWPLVARDAERSAIVATMAGAGARSLLVRGPVGCGASRLLAHAADQADAEHHRVLRLSARPSVRDVPFGVLGAVVPELIAGAEGERAALVATAVLALRSGAWSAVTVDDVTHLDDATASVIHHLVVGGLLGFVATVHDVEPLPEPIAALRVADLLEVLTLRPLGVEDVAELVEQALGGHLDGGSTRRLTIASSGSPLMVVELVRAALEDGSLHLDHGTWRWDQTATTPHRLTDLVDRQLERLSPAGRQVCAIVAMADSLSLDEVTELGISAVTTYVRARVVVCCVPGAPSVVGVTTESVVEADRGGLGEVVDLPWRGSRRARPRACEVDGVVGRCGAGQAASARG